MVNSSICFWLPSAKPQVWCVWCFWKTSSPKPDTKSPQIKEVLLRPVRRREVSSWENICTRQYKQRFLHYTEGKNFSFWDLTLCKDPFCWTDDTSASHSDLQINCQLKGHQNSESIHTHKRESLEISKSNPPRFEGCRPPRNANKVSKDRLFNVDCHGQKKIRISGSTGWENPVWNLWKCLLSTILNQFWWFFDILFVSLRCLKNINGFFPYQFIQTGKIRFRVFATVTATIYCC